MWDPDHEAVISLVTLDILFYIEVDYTHTYKSLVLRGDLRMVKGPTILVMRGWVA